MGKNKNKMKKQAIIISILYVHIVKAVNTILNTANQRYQGTKIFLKTIVFHALYYF